MQKVLLSYVQPVMVATILLFWAFGPVDWIQNPWSIVVATLATTALIQALEWVKERHSSWRLTRQEFFTDVFYVVLSYSVIAWATKTFADEPMMAAKQALGIATPWAMHLPFVLQVALVVVLIEFGQYWLHRLMHNQSFFWSTHAPHHHLTQLNAMKGAVGNPLELFLISLSVIALLDLPQAAIFCALNILAVVSTFAHANTRFDPPRWYAFVFTTIQNHSLHHSMAYDDTRCNYGNSLILLDRLFGTYRSGEAELVGQDERRRLSIPEQFLFPVRPLIDRISERRSGSDTEMVA